MTTPPAVQIGAPAPAFTLPGTDGKPISPLTDFPGRSVLIVFYPFAFSGTCTAELCEIRDDLGSFVNDDVAVVAVSCDPWHSLRAFADAQRYEFPLLSDFWPHGAVSETFGVFDRRAGFAGRGTFLVDSAGTLRWSQVNSAGQARSVQGYRDALARL